MSPRTNAQFEQIRGEKRKIIMDAAFELFANDGYHQSSIAKIAKQAKISKGLVYNYFDSKESLLTHIVENGFSDIMEFFEISHIKEMTPKEFCQVIDQMFESVKKNTRFWRLFYSLLLQSDVAHLLSPKVTQTFELMYSLMGEYFQNQNFEDPEKEVMFFGALMEGTMIQFVAAPNIYPIDMMKQLIIERYT